MKYYGLKYKKDKENFLYFYARYRAKVLSILFTKKREFWKRNYEYIYKNEYYHKGDNNSLPENSIFDLDSIVIADLIRREDIKKLQKGVRLFLKKRMSNRFLTPIEGLDEMCRKIEQMDASLLSWYSTVDCGFFEFKNHPLENSIDYFSMKICNVNSGYLSLIFNIHLNKEKKSKLGDIISCYYDNRRGYATQTMTGKSNTTGAYRNYTLVHYNNNALKADKIYEFISYIEWEFMHELNTLFPFVLHNRNIMPPRIETYSTNIDYHNDERYFWDSIGIDGYQGQFLDERHKVFFENRLSGRYGDLYSNNRIIYIFKDDGIEFGQLKSIKDEVYYHVDKYAIEYFKFIFLDMLSREAGKALVAYKHKLDKIKLRKNQLETLLKLKYKLSMEIDDYSRYKRDDIWGRAEKKLSKVYKYSDKIAESASKPFFISYSKFCKGAILESEKIDKDIAVILDEFEEKKRILQNLADYKNTNRSMMMNIIMLIISAITLFFVIFPDKAKETADIITEILLFIVSKVI